MYDFDEKKDGKVVRRASLLDELGQKIWDGFIARDETHITSVELTDLASYFIKLKGKYPEIDQCLIFYEDKRGKYEISQVMLDKEGNELRTNNKMCVGRKLVVNQMSSSVLSWFDEKTSKIMKMDNIF